jgi:hypothetical protein
VQVTVRDCASDAILAVFDGSSGTPDEDTTDLEQPFYFPVGSGINSVVIDGCGFHEAAAAKPV